VSEPVLGAQREELAGKTVSRRSLSVCCLTHGRSPARLAAILRLLRPVADEIVVALDDAARESASLLAGVADRILLFSHIEPGDRPIAWLCRACRGDWIFNIDDDEIPSARLVRALPWLVARDDVTHCWVARRWLYPDVTTYLDEPPWNTEYQLRLFKADDRFLRFTDQFHRPIACEGPMRFVSAPLWHLDTALGSRADRERKALRYEQSRRGMRIGDFSHNTGIYVPELRSDPVVQPVPPHELRTIERILSSYARRGGGASIEEPTPAAVDREWPGEPHAASLYESSITLLTNRPRFVADVQQTIDVRIKNLGQGTWRFGDDSITIGTRWDGQVEGLRTSLPADVLPGESSVVPVHVLPPAETGPHVLEVDLVHEHVRWFERPLRVDVDVIRRRRVLVAGRADDLAPVLDSIALVPEIEPLVMLEVDDVDLGPPRVDGIGQHLFGADGLDGWRSLPRALGLVLRARSGNVPSGARSFSDALRESECLIVVGDDVHLGAPPTRDRLRTLTIVRTARAQGVPVWRVGEGGRPGSIADRALQRAIGACARTIAADSLSAALLTQT
jgi:hypothetical protein